MKHFLGQIWIEQNIPEADRTDTENIPLLMDKSKHVVPDCRFLTVIL